MKRVYWGDIHNHNEIGYASGTMERSFALAENTLDFYAFTPHGWWTDVPADDEKIRRQHVEGFAKVRSRWDEVAAMVSSRHRPGAFVTFAGWEWHSQRWGDYCIYFPGDEAEIHDSGTLDDLKDLARRTGSLLIPHHPGYRRGWRGLDWSTLDPELSPVVEIFSEHGNSLEPSSPWGMYSHSMGGMDRTQSGIEQLRGGRRFGLLASGDDHFGYPGAYGQGLTAVFADDLTREGIMAAIRARHTYAVTGDRILVDFSVNGGLPGDTVSASDGVSMSGRVEARDRIRSVEILKNGYEWKRFAGSRPRPRPIPAAGDMSRPSADNDRHLLRIEWGWDLLTSEVVTTWDIGVRVTGGAVHDVVPSFCGGAGSVTELNLLRDVSERSFGVLSYTSRRNTLPVSSISCVWEGPRDSSVTVELTGRNGKEPFSSTLEVGKEELAGCDQYASAFSRFSSPKLKLHALVNEDERALDFAATDDEAYPGDFYLLKVEQENGQMAWCSPVWLAEEDT